MKTRQIPFIAIITTACMLLPSYITPLAHAAVNTKGNETLTLEQCVSNALAHNFDVYIAELQNKISLYKIDIEKAKYDTMLTASADYTHDQREKSSAALAKQDILSTMKLGLQKLFPSGTNTKLSFEGNRSSNNTNTLNPYYENSLAVSLTQPLLKNSFGFIDRAEVKLVKIDVSQADLDTLSRIETIVANTNTAYFDLMYAYDLYQAQEDGLKRAQALLTIYEDQIKTGVVEETDLFAAQANVLIKENELSDARDMILNKSNDLKFVMNYYPDSVLVPAHNDIFYEIDPTLDYHLNLAFTHRRDYKNATLDLEAQDITIKINTQKLWPQLDLKATFTSNGIDEKAAGSLDDALRNGDDEYFVGGSFSLPLENREARATLSQSQEQKAIYIAKLHQLEKNINLEVDKNLRKILLEKKKYDTNKTVADLQSKKEQEEEKKFKMGRSSSDLLIRYQNDAINAQIQERLTYITYLKAIINLKKSEHILLNEVRMHNEK